MVAELAPWVSTDLDNQPLSIMDIQIGINNSISLKLSNEFPTDIYIKPFVCMYGLYSRHGRFYPPYGYLPDIHYGEFLYNIQNLAINLFE